MVTGCIVVQKLWRGLIARRRCTCIRHMFLWQHMQMLVALLFIARGLQADPMCIPMQHGTETCNQCLYCMPCVQQFMQCTAYGSIEFHVQELPTCSI